MLFVGIVSFIDINILGMFITLREMVLNNTILLNILHQHWIKK